MRARLCSEPAAWKWSGYPAMLGLVPRPAFLTDSWVLRHFAQDRVTARDGLRRFVEGSAPAPLQLRAGVSAAGDKFLKDVLRDTGPIAEIPRRQWQPVPPSLAEIFTKTERPVASAYRQYGYTLRDIACHLGCHYSTVSRRLRREEDA